jgi:hypothetical protein
MSDQTGQHRDPTPDGDPVVTVVLIFGGTILLLPGVCSVIFFPDLSPFGNADTDSLLTAIWLAGALIGLCGVALVVFGIRRLFAPRR